MEIISIHLCTYKMEDLYSLVEKDLNSRGLTLTNKIPTSKVVEGKTQFVFEATGAGPALPLPAKPKRVKTGGRVKKGVVAPAENPL